MKAVVFRQFGGPDVLQVVDRPTPPLDADQVRVAVAAATVHRFDLLTRAGGIVQAGIVEPPVSPFEWGLGWDFAGRIHEAPDRVNWRPGDAVIGMLPAIAVTTGAQAELIVVDPEDLAPAPNGVASAQAATLPLDGLTAMAAVEAAALSRGQHLVVIGGTGGVGRFAVQLALLGGLRVTATASDGEGDELRELGAMMVTRDALPHGVDAVIDTPGVGSAALEPLRDGGTLVTLAGAVESDRAIRSVQVRVSQLDRRGERLAELSKLTERGELLLPPVRTFPLSRVAQAHEQLAAGGMRRRLVLEP